MIVNGQINKLEQKSFSPMEEMKNLKEKEGVAGVFAGVHGDVMIVAGGTAYPDKKPWKNGKKYFSDKIMVFERLFNGKIKLKDSSCKLPFGFGEGASVSLPVGVLCIGGNTPEGLTNKVFLLSWKNEKIEIIEYPKLPVPVRNPAATVIDSKVYLVGGECSMGATNQFLMLNVDHIDNGWSVLPSFPISVSGAMASSQMDGEEVSVYVFGGRAKKEGDIFSTFYRNVFRFRPSLNKWEPKKDICFPLAVGAAVKFGASHIVLTGGDTGDIFCRVEKAIWAMQQGENEACKLRDSLWINHPGFNNEILVYNTVTDTWFEAGKWEGEPVAVAPAIKWDGHVIIPGGEISPAVRTPKFHEFNFLVTPVFGWLNYLILGLYFVGMIFLGFKFMKKECNTDDFFKARGRIPWWAAGISIFATTLSAITFIAIPAKAYATDWRMFFFNMAIIAIAPIVIRYFLPFFRKFNFDTAYQYLEVRFSRTIRWIASILFIFFMISRIAVVLFLPSLTLNVVTGFSVYWSIIIMGIVTVIYCTSGGIEAVVWGDVIQGFILIVGASIALIFMFAGVKGGIEGFFKISTDYHKFKIFDFRFDMTQPVFWVVLVGGLANTLITYTSDQSVIQRYMTTKDEKSTGNSIWLNGFLSIPVSIIFFLLGTGLYSYYTSNPEQMDITNTNIDSVFPQFIVSQMPVGIAGLLIAAIFAAAMSTLSSNINSVSAVVTSDFYNVLHRHSSSRQKMNVARWSGVIVGGVGICMALIIASWNIASLWDQFNTFLGLLTGGLGALFVMGIFFRRISGNAALFGVFSGLIILLFLKRNTSLSFLLYGFIGLTVSVLLGLLWSLFFPNRKVIKGYVWEKKCKK